MKRIIFVFIVLGFFCNCNNSISKEKKTVISKNKSDKTAAEFYRESLDTLDSIWKYSITNEDFVGIQSIKILSEISGYEGSGNKNYYGTIGFKDEDLTYWKEWFKKNKDSLCYLYEPQSILQMALNVKMHQVIKVDTLERGYIIYSVKNDSIFKILSARSKPSRKCEKIKVGAYYDFKLKLAKYSVHMDSLLYKEQKIKFEKNSINDLFFSEHLIGLCYIR